MLYEAVSFLVTAIALAASSLVLYTYIKCRLALWSFKRKSNNLPILGDMHQLGNHVSSWALKKNLCNELARQHSIIGKTIGWLYNDHFGASTIDLDVIKQFIYDEPNLHINRVQINVPLREMEGSLMLAEDDKWRKLRRHFAPAFK